MAGVDGDYNLLTKFSKFTAEEYAKSIKEKNLSIASVKASKLIKYIEKRYESKIKKALEKNPNCNTVTIALPYLLRINNDGILMDVEKIIEEHFKTLGFNVYMRQDSLCDCMFDIICNRNRFYIKLDWI